MFSLKYIFPISVFLGTLSAMAQAQSVDQSAPTKIPGAEVVSSVGPRKEGDPRLTTHFFSIDVRQGDLYLNVMHRNFVGDVDLFSIDARRPLGKLTIVESPNEREIGRVIFIRNSGQVLIRVEGRTPNDESGLYRLKFGGSALAIKESNPVLDFRRFEPLPPTSNESLKKGDANRPTESVNGLNPTDPVSRSGEGSVAESSTGKTSEGSDPKELSDVVAVTPQVADESQNLLNVIQRKLTLRIEFDDGGRVERPMSSVSRVAIERDQLVVILANGSESRYPISSVVKFSVD
jgi:hypothetical protein